MVKQSPQTSSSSSTHPLLEARQITFGYKQQPLLYSVSLSVDAREMVGLLGPNGSGKTTLLRLLSGALEPQQGSILLEGKDLHTWGRRNVAQRIAVVPQELHIPFAFTVEQMIELGRTPFITSFFGTLKQHDRHIVTDAMAASGTTAFAARVFNELSGGERQRVMIAMALAQQPSVLLLDEPTSHLDIKYQIETLELVQQLNRERGVTVIAAMHDLNLAARYFPRLLLFQRGIVADASPAEVLEPRLLSRVYGINVQVGILRGSEHLSVLPPGTLNEEEGKEQKHTPRVHVIAGGGSGELMMRALADAAIPFVAGALNIGDSDHALALRLADEVITEQPYAPIAPTTLQQVRDSLKRVALLIICPVPIGPGNLCLLEEATQAAHHGLPVILLSPAQQGSDDVASTGSAIDTDDGLLERSGMAARDYTGGRGLKLAGELLQAGAQVVSSVSEAIERIMQIHQIIGE
jgi:iron complex transport system ATP-binding protein